MKKFAIALVRRAGARVREEQRSLSRLSFKAKTTKEVVTKSDLIANEMMIAAIRRRYPRHDLLTEEAGSEEHEGQTRWIIDPIDGTTNYLTQLPLYAVSVAVEEAGEMKVGVTYAPALGELFVAEQSKGATMNGRLLRPSPIRSMGEAIVDFCRPHSSVGTRKALRMQLKVSSKIQSGRYLGSACLSLAYVACGRMEATYMVGPSPLWDVAAGVLLVREAGGKVTDSSGKEWRHGAKDLVATNGKIHIQLLKAFNA